MKIKGRSTHHAKPLARDSSITGAIKLAALKIVFSAFVLNSRSSFDKSSFFTVSFSMFAAMSSFIWKTNFS